MTADPHQPPDHQRRETPLTPELPELPADTARPLEEQLPPTILATPSHVSPLSGEEIRWWRPRWQDAWRHVGYRWIFLLPAVALLIWLALAILSPALFEVLIVLGIKLGIFMVAVALTLGGYVLRRAAQARREPFCIYCGYSLNGLTEPRCPECGQAFEPQPGQLVGALRV